MAKEVKENQALKHPTAIFVSDQTEFPLDDEKDKGKEAPGQLSLLKGSGN